MRKQKELEIEATLTELVDLVKKIEDEDTSLQDSLITFERGVHLTKKAQQALLAAEQKITLLLKDADEPELENFLQGNTT
ncbi:MAG: exodeoxyribonuclease VII small subunit [Halioglobus sp.]